MVRFENVSHSHAGRQSGLREINLTVSKGDFLFVVAPTAEYKTTLLDLVYGRVIPDAGTVGVFEFTLPADRRLVHRLRQQTGYVFHDFHFFENLTVAENLLIPLLIRSDGREPERLDGIVEEALRKCPELAPGHPVSMLSSGEKQALNFLRALLGDPLLLLADDPFKHFQKNATDRFMEMLAEQNNRGTTVIVTTSNAALPREYNKPFCTLKGGRLTHGDA